MSRRYELKRRAERQRETRQRIIDAAVALHATTGPARTTIKGVAERAGVQRHTVYRHFPTEDALFAACASTWDERNPFPDPDRWDRIADPEARLRRALADVYGYYRRVAPELGVILRDAELVPALRRVIAEDATNRQRLRNSLAAGWRARGRRRMLLLALTMRAPVVAGPVQRLGDVGVRARRRARAQGHDRDLRAHHPSLEPDHVARGEHDIGSQDDDATRTIRRFQGQAPVAWNIAEQGAQRLGGRDRSGDVRLVPVDVARIVIGHRVGHEVAPRHELPLEVRVRGVHARVDDRDRDTGAARDGPSASASATRPG